jgi:peptide/nickel transport system ATP-binding protein
MSVILITHDLGVIAETCDEVVVMYAGRVVERAPSPSCSKTRCTPTPAACCARSPLWTPVEVVLNTIPGMVASLAEHTHGCRFCQRMGRIARITRERPPFPEVSPGHWVETCPECYKP